MGTAAHARTLAAPALEILSRHTPNSYFSKMAEDALAQGTAAHYGLERVAEALEGWLRFVEAGLAELPPRPVEARLTAATDLMEQVQELLSDPRIHPAAPVVLAGAALEEFLRSQVIARSIAVTGKPGINSYAAALRAEGVLTPQDVKDVTSWAGQRNEAAHGQFERLSRERAQLMVDGINLFLRSHA